MSELRQLEAVPPGLLEAEPDELLALLGGPTLLHLKAGMSGPGALAQTLFVSVLLHGNETSGWYAVQRLLRDVPTPPRELMILIGNVEAAAAGMRTLPGQQDFNRMWREPQGVARDVLRCVAKQPLLAVVDLHNNTGRNPHYSVLTDFSAGSRGLAALFCDTAVFIEEPDTVMTRAFSPQTPNVALELGPVGDAEAVGRAYGFLCKLIALERIPEAAPKSTQLYRTLARVHPPDGARFVFSNRDSDTVPADWLRRGATGDAEAAPPIRADGFDLVLDDAIEASNFARLPVGTLFGVTAGGPGLEVLDNGQKNVTSRYFEIRNGRILLKSPVVPAMYTTDPGVVRQDCLCYFMAPLDPKDGMSQGRAA